MPAHSRRASLATQPLNGVDDRERSFESECLERKLRIAGVNGALDLGCWHVVAEPRPAEEYFWYFQKMLSSRFVILGSRSRVPGMRLAIVGLIALLAVSVGSAGFATPAQADTTFPCGGGGTYTVNASNEVTGNSSCAGAVTFDESVTSIGTSAFIDARSLTSVTIGSGVISIGNGAFRRASSLTSVTIGSGVISIGAFAFSGASSLTSVTIPNSVTSIGEAAFKGASSLTSVTIPNSVTSIGEAAFLDVSSLTSFSVSGNNISYSSLDGVLFNKLQTTLIRYPEAKAVGSYTIPSSVTSIDISAFSGASALTGATIPSSVTSIGAFAFKGASALTSVTIPNSVTSIGNGAFLDASSLMSFSVSGDNSSYSSLDGTLFNKLQTTLIRYPQAKAVGSYTIPSSVTSIGASAFSGASSLLSVTLHSSVASIGETAFKGASSLTSVTIPNSVTSIGNGAFLGTSSLTSFSVSGDNSSYSSLDGVLFNKLQTTLIRYPQAKALASYTIPSSVTSISNEAFKGASSLTSVTIGTGVSSIRNSAFEGASSLRSVTIGSGVTSIGNEAFFGARSLASVTFLGNAPSVGSFAFDGVPAGAKAYRAAGLTGYGVDGSTFYGLIVALPVPPAPPAPPVPPVPPVKPPVKPALVWSSSAKAKTITAVITPVAGVSYTLAATSGRVTKKGSCKNVMIKQGKKKVARRSCTVKLAKGTWRASVTPAKGAVKGTANTKSYKFK